MIIRKVRMQNFRCFCDKTIDFEDKSVVLLSAANGIGKTSTIDAIEWCLTGKIGRLKKAFDNRSTNDEDRKQNTNGILKNRDASDMSMVKVTLWIVNEDNVTVISREQTKDELNPDVSKVTIDGNEKAANEFINKYVGNSFYNFHICDVQKSFSVQSTKRRDLEMLFSEFITSYDEQKQIADNIDIFADDVDRYIEDKRRIQQISQELIRSLEEQLVKTHEEANNITYSDTVFYPGEHVEIVGLDRNELIKQKAELENCGYIIVKNEISKLINNDSLKRMVNTIKRIITNLIEKDDSIRQAIVAGLFYNDDVISSLELQLEKLNELTLTKSTIFRDVEIIATYNSRSDIFKELEELKKNFQDKDKRVTMLSSEIDLLTKNNAILRLFSTLSLNKETIVKYRNDTMMKSSTARCPVCGADTFATMDEHLILNEVDDYIKQNGELVIAKENEIKNLQIEVDNHYEKIKIQVEEFVQNEKGVIEEKLSTWKKLKFELKPYFDAVRELQIDRKEITIESINIENMISLQRTIESQLLTDSAENEAKELVRKILTVLGYAYEDEALSQTYEKVKILISNQYEINNFSYEEFVYKIQAINNTLTNQAIASQRMRLEGEREKNKILDTEIRELLRLKEEANDKSNSIRSAVEKLTKDEYLKIGPTLYKYYNKLVRINDNSGFNIIRENDGLSLVDNKRKNIVNTLSNGQINVFLLAYFFAGISIRNKREKMKIFFIDDLTACMDDVNMLAFMDLLKYQIYSKETIDQLFFITCDDRISRLLKYKMNRRGIKLKELLEADFES